MTRLEPPRPKRGPQTSTLPAELHSDYYLNDAFRKL